jgi:hypothetical protein
MILNEYLAERIVRDRLNEARARAVMEALLEAARPPHRSIRTVVGHSFVEFGHWVLADGHGRPSGYHTASATGPAADRDEVWRHTGGKATSL